MAYNDKVVDVTVTLGTQPIDTKGFETPLFLAIHNVFPERVRAYTELSQLVDDGFAVGTPAYNYASKAFSGTFRPQYLMIGRQGFTNTVVDFTGQTNTDPETPVALNFVSGAYQKSIIVNVSASSQANAIATSLADAINADTTLQTVLTATASEAKVTIAPKDDGKFSVGRDSGNMVISNTSDETVSSVLPQVMTANENWYFVSTESHTKTSILSAAAFAAANYKMHVYSTADEKSKTADTDSIADQLKALQYDTSIGMYDPLADSEYPEGGIIGAMASNDPSYGDSIHLKTMDGVVAPTLSATERMTIWGKNLNFYRMINGVGSFYEGKCASGNYVDVVRFGHWLKFRTEESVFGYMSRRSNMGLSVKMSDDDLPNLKSVIMNNPINVGISNGAILTGYDEVNKVFFDPVITIPLRGSIPTNDLAARTLNNVKVELVYNTPLHFVKIRMTVMLDKTGSNSGNAQTVTAGV